MTIIKLKSILKMLAGIIIFAAICVPETQKGSNQTPKPANPASPATTREKPRPPAPVLLRVTPNRVAAGAKAIELKIEGRNFAPGAQVTFGGSQDIFTPDPVVFVNATEIHVSIDVLPTALTGGRDVIIRNPGNVKGTGKRMINILPAKGPSH